MSPDTSLGPRVSVLVPAYNAARFIARAAESILGQTMTDLELIIVDDGSTDGTGAIIDACAARDRRVRVVHQANGGPAAALNRALEMSRGAYLARLDGDDIALPDRLEKQAAFLDRFADIAMVGGAITLIDGEDRKLSTRFYPAAASMLRARAALGSHVLVAGPAPMMRRELAVTLGGYRTVFDFAEDYDFTLRALEKGAVANLEDVVVYYRIHPDQVSQTGRARQHARAEAARALARFRQSGNVDAVSGDWRLEAATVDRLGLDKTETERLRALFPVEPD